MMIRDSGYFFGPPCIRSMSNVQWKVVLKKFMFV